MRVVSVNVNGIRSAASKGFFDWMAREAPDVVCIQETKAQIDQLGDPVQTAKYVGISLLLVAVATI